MSIRHIVSQETARLADEASDRLSDEFRLRIEDRLSEAQAGVGACPPQVSSPLLLGLSLSPGLHASHLSSHIASWRRVRISCCITPLTAVRTPLCHLTPHISLLSRLIR